MKSKRVLRADTLRHMLNAGKEAKIRNFVKDYRRLCVGLGYQQWRLFFQAGHMNRRHSDKSFGAICGAAAAQMARHQVVEQIDGFVSNRANEFRNIVNGSALPAGMRHVLHVINRRQAWFSREDVWMPRSGVIIPIETRALARAIMRHILSLHRKPNLSNISPRLDIRLAKVAPARTAITVPIWATLRLPKRGSINVPLLPHNYYSSRQGELCPVIQIVMGVGDAIGFRLVTDVTKAFAATKAAYLPKTERLALDFGLATLIASDRGDLVGRAWLGDLKRIDKQLVGIARHRTRSGGRPRESVRYCRLVGSLRGMIKTRINAALNRMMTIHAPAEIVVERLNFQNPNLSRRLNRILQNCGRSVFNAKLADLNDKFGIEVTEVNPAYTSQECSSCGYVDKRNRISQSKFSCRWCGREIHADVNGAVVIGSRRSRSDAEARTKADILHGAVHRHAERWPGISPRRIGRNGTAADPRLTNRYFADWSVGARMLQTAQDLMPCVQNQ